MSYNSMSESRKWYVCSVLIMALMVSLPSVDAAPVEVRYPEGVSQGFVILHSLEGTKLAQGELRQVASGSDRLVSRLTFRFLDGSLHDETVVFSQKRVFALVSYRLVQQGPSFPDAMDISLNRESGQYTVRQTERGSEEYLFTGQLHLPSDIYNGMAIVILKNLEGQLSETIHMVGFMPDPKLFEVQITPVGTERIHAGGIKKQVIHYALKPKLGWFLRSLAFLLQRAPPEYHLWILKEDVPAFMRFEGPLYPDGPTWRIEQVSPHSRQNHN
jgi:hypothetical protein